MDKTALTRGGRGPVGLPEDDVEIPGVGTVRVRGVNRGELLHSNKLNDTKGQLDAEQYILSCALIDPADMTVEDVAAWQASSGAMECQPVLHKINQLSGVGKDVAKEAYKSVRDEPDAGV